MNEKSTFMGELCAQQKKEMPDPFLRPSWDIVVVNLEPRKFCLILSLQHLDFDGTSLSVFIDELRDIYGALLQGRSAALPPTIQYSTFASWQDHYRKNAIDTDRAYFQGLFSTVPHLTPLPKHDGFTKTLPLSVDTAITSAEMRELKNRCRKACHPGYQHKKPKVL